MFFRMIPARSIPHGAILTSNLHLYTSV